MPILSDDLGLEDLMKTEARSKYVCCTVFFELGAKLDALSKETGTRRQPEVEIINLTLCPRLVISS